MTETLLKASVKRGPRGRFLPGQAPKSPGRPPGDGLHDLWQELVSALRSVEADDRKPFLVDFVEKAYTSRPYGLALFNKLIANRQITDQHGAQIVNIIYPPDWSRLGDTLRLREGGNGAAVPAPSDASQSL